MWVVYSKRCCRLPPNNLVRISRLREEMECEEKALIDIAELFGVVSV